jgi:hypothetical protein
VTLNLVQYYTLNNQTLLFPATILLVSHGKLYQKITVFQACSKLALKDVKRNITNVGTFIIQAKTYASFAQKDADFALHNEFLRNYS